MKTNETARKQKPSELTRYSIGEDDLISIHGHKMRYAKTYDEGLLLRSANENDKQPPVPYNWERISQLLSSGLLQVDVGYFSERNAIERARNVKSFELDAEKVLRARMVSEFLAQEEGDPDWSAERLHRSDDDIERFHALFIAGP